MKRVSFLIILFLFQIMLVSIVYAMTIDIQVSGQDEISSMKDTISKTTETRCLAKGIDLSKFNKLNINISKLGNVYSFDAVLDTTPPKAFHKDMKGTDDLTSTIDEMIASLFSLQAPQQAVIPQIKDIELDFKATSITILNNDIYISDNKKTIYLLKDGNPSVWWTCKDKGPIYRIWAYQDSIMALVNHSQDFNNDVFVSYRIKDGEIIKTWNGAVLPMGKGLIWSDISMPPDLTEESNRWSATQVADGTPDLLFPGMDPLASLRAEVVPWCDGVEIIAFSGATGRLMVFSKDKTNPKKKSMGWWQKTKNALSGSEDPIWSSEAQFSRLPLFIKQVYIEKTSKGMDAEPKEREVDYFIPPRILVDSGNMIAIDNNQGLWSIIDKATYFKSCQLRLYSWNGTDFTESFLMKSSFGYCVDITIKDGSVLALIVTDQGTKLRTVSLKANIT